MKKLIFTALTLTCAMASTIDLQAYNTCPKEGVYVNLLGGANLLKFDDSKFNYEENPIVEDFKLDEVKLGYIVGGAIGYQFNYPVRLEAEFTYRNTTIFADKGGDQYLKANLDVNATTYTFMTNAYYDFSTGTRFTPYVGLGLGLVKTDIHADLKVKSKETIADTNVNHLSGGVSARGKYDFGMQGKAGISYAINEKTALGLEYSYLHSFASVQNHAVTLNLRRSF